MDDLISRQAAIDAIWNTEQHDVKSTVAYNRRLKQLVKIINAVAKLPSAQQIVRCKDCRWYDGDYCQKNGDDWGGDWYCADGERRE